MAAKFETPHHLAELANAKEKQLREPLNADSRFSINPVENILNLAKKAYPKNQAEQDRYAKKIQASLENHLKDGVSINALWDYLKNNYCQTTAIIEGVLKFFSGTKSEKEIQITQFLKPPELTVETILEKTKNAKRTEMVNSTRQNLQQLLAELKESMPNLPA